jgi:ech hydrogenase subunit B
MDLSFEALRGTILALVLLGLAPLLGMLAMGIGRKMSARMQNRVGPPILQPLYDVQKLLMKVDQSTNPLIGPMAMAFALLNIVAVVLLVAGWDLLMVVVVLGMAQLFLTLGGFAGSSPYSHIGANRNLLQVLSVEPLLLAVPIGVLLVNGSYFVNTLAMSPSILFYFPVAVAVVMFALVVWMQKGPFDMSTAHQEILYGNLIEFSGKNLALVEMGHWFENFALLSIVGLFFNFTPFFSGPLGLYPAIVVDLLLKMIIAFVALLVVIWIDNATTRNQWDRLPKFAFYIMLPAVFINVILIYGKLRWGWF